MKKSFDSDSKSIILKLKYNLNNEGFHTSNDSRNIKFKRVYKSTTHRSENITSGSMILREGKIRIEEISEKKMKILYNVRLDYIIFISLIFGLFSGIALTFFGDIKIVTSIIIGLLISSFIFMVEYFILRFRMTELIKICI